MRALITGGKGFVGRWLEAHLHQCGDEVVVVDRETDVADPASIRRAVVEAAPDAVYHLAALSHVGESWEAPHEVLRVNVLGTSAVLAAAREAPGTPKVLVVSSAEIYGIVAAPDLPLAETRPPAPVTPYAASKAAAEQVALQAHRGFGQPVVVVRPFNHIGPGQEPRFVVAALAQRVVEARRHGASTLTVGTVTTRRDFVDVRDVVRAYRLLIETAEPGSVFNVCSGRDVSIETIVRRLLDLAGVDLDLVPDPALQRPVDVPVLRGSPVALEAATGWRPELALDDTLRDVLASFEHGEG